jgi:hypothetical protein
VLVSAAYYFSQMAVIFNVCIGGMIALGMGVHKWTVDECIIHYKNLCKEGMQRKSFVDIPILGWFARIWRRSIYHTGPLEVALSSSFSHQKLYGIRNSPAHETAHCPRVAVTTTTREDSTAMLLANYSAGKSGHNYMNSRCRTWQA